MRVRFWGTRGSIAKPGPTTLRYGGNTPCVEVEGADGTLLILDCGTGIHALGQKLAASRKPPLQGHLLISHYHWDHIQGFPFFTPLFIPGNEWHIYGPGGMDHQLQAILAGQMTYSYFPISLEEFGSSVHYHNLGEGAFDIGGLRISTQYTNHPALTLAFRVEAGGASFTYIPDHEPSSLFSFDNGGPGPIPLHLQDRRHVEFLKGSDLLAHDAQYTLQEYPSKVSWGHSPYEKTVEYAVAGGVKRLALFHHDPLRTDRDLDGLVGTAEKMAAKAGGGLEVMAAAEGWEIELPEDPAWKPPPIPASCSAWLSGGGPKTGGTILIVDDDPLMVRLLEKSLEAENAVRLVTAHDGEAALKLAMKERPLLIILDWGLPKMDGIEVCRALRRNEDTLFRKVPILMVTGKRLDEKDVQKCFDAGASDYLTKKFSPTQLRSRVRSWLLRSASA
ncbi:MAG: response regulator [Candidatus Tectomicrobia bacterium]|uniref:Response regulator n=1 Tax=Tectimicrobiota bacterium TaxID=2528274 RepID=A0A932HZH5_UNCTE|nr:response regulator [Candidatus Tectomicrobia bacterium]